MPCPPLQKAQTALNPEMIYDSQHEEEGCEEGGIGNEADWGGGRLVIGDRKEIGK